MLRLFGVPRFDGSSVRLPAKAYVLFAYLLLEHRNGLSRNEAATFLWGETEQAKAFTNLRQLLAAIVRWQDAMGGRALVLEGRALWPGPALAEADVDQLLAFPTPSDGKISFS